VSGAGGSRQVQPARRPPAGAGRRRLRPVADWKPAAERVLMRPVEPYWARGRRRRLVLARAGWKNIGGPTAPALSRPRLAGRGEIRENIKSGRPYDGSASGQPAPRSFGCADATAGSRESSAGGTWGARLGPAETFFCRPRAARFETFQLQARESKGFLGLRARYCLAWLDETGPGLLGQAPALLPGPRGISSA